MIRKIITYILKKSKFPYGCESGNELDWILKNNCPCCISKPIESISNEKYKRKYPANNKITFGGNVQIFLCDTHAEELREALNKNKKYFK